MPPLHPFFVHFPIALLTIGFCADLLAVMRKKPAVQKIGWWNLALGTAGLIVAVISGLAAKSDYLQGTEAILKDGLAARSDYLQGTEAILKDGLAAKSDYVGKPDIQPMAWSVPAACMQTVGPTGERTDEDQKRTVGATKDSMTHSRHHSNSLRQTSPDNAHPRSSVPRSETVTISDGTHVRERPPDALASHEQLAFATVALSLLLLYWRIRNRTAVPPASPHLYLLCGACLIALLWCTAWFGGELVYGFGVGVVHNPVP